MTAAGADAFDVLTQSELGWPIGGEDRAKAIEEMYRVIKAHDPERARHVELARAALALRVALAVRHDVPIPHPLRLPMERMVQQIDASIEMRKRGERRYQIDYGSAERSRSTGSRSARPPACGQK